MKDREDDFVAGSSKSPASPENTATADTHETPAPALPGGLDVSAATRAMVCAQTKEPLVRFERWMSKFPQPGEWFIHGGERHEIVATGQGKIERKCVPVVVIQRTHTPGFRMIPFGKIEYVGNREKIRKWALKRPEPLRDFPLLQENDLKEE